MDYLLALIELFSLGVTAKALRAIIGSKSCRRVAPTNHSSSQKTMLNDLSYGIKIWTDLSTVLSQFTRVTDGQTEFSSLTASAFHAAR